MNQTPNIVALVREYLRLREALRSNGLALLYDEQQMAQRKQADAYAEEVLRNMTALKALGW